MRVTKSWNGILLDPNATASPCGSIGIQYFNQHILFLMIHINYTIIMIQRSPLIKLA